MKPYKFIISGGGTGGHIYPAIAIADELRQRYPDAEFLFVGANDRMEMDKVPQAGYRIKGLWISGLQRKLSLKNLMFPFKLLSSLFKSKQILNKFKLNTKLQPKKFFKSLSIQTRQSVQINRFTWNTKS